MLCLCLSIVARPASVARVLVAHGNTCSMTTRTMSHHQLGPSSFTVITQRSSWSLQGCPLVNYLNRSLFSCRTYSEGVTSSSGSEDSSSGEEDEWTSLYDRVATASLTFVDQHGWSREAIQAGVKSLGLPGVAHGVMGDGGHELLKYFEQQCNDELEKYLQTELQPLLFNEEPDKRYHLAIVMYTPKQGSHEQCYKSHEQ